MINNEIITQELNHIILVINNMKSWDDDTKIRYAYIELGKLIHKNVMFFYTIQNNLKGADKEEIRLKSNDISDIMNDDSFINSVVCITSANMLKYIFDNTNIESKIMETAKSDIYVDQYGEAKITHFFVCVTGNDSKKYFLTLNADLHNIQSGFATEHFANNIPYMYETGERAYVGEEIHNTVLTDEEIRVLDERIGYLNTYFNDSEDLSYNDDINVLLRRLYYNKNSYQSMLARETSQYFDLVKLLNGDKSLEEVLKNPTNIYKDNSEIYLHANLREIDENRWNDIKKFAFVKTIDKYFIEYNITFSNEDIDLLVSKISNLEFSDILNILRKNIPQEKKGDDLSPNAVLAKLEGFLNSIDEL